MVAHDDCDSVVSSGYDALEVSLRIEVIRGNRAAMLLHVTERCEMDQWSDGLVNTRKTMKALDVLDTGMEWRCGLIFQGLFD
jgi:hypothetical protein